MRGNQTNTASLPQLLFESLIGTPPDDNDPLWFAKRAVTMMELIQRYWRVALIVNTDEPLLVGLLPVA